MLWGPGALNKEVDTKGAEWDERESKLFQSAAPTLMQSVKQLTDRAPFAHGGWARFVLWDWR